MNHRFRNWWKSSRPSWWKGPPPAEPEKKRIEPPKLRINPLLVERFRNKPSSGQNPFVMPRYAPGVLPDGKTTMAMDDGPNQQIQATFQFGSQFHGAFAEGIGFMGYPYLASLSQRPEYRIPSEVIAEEMTRKWIVLKAEGKEDKSAKVAALTRAMNRYKLREAFRDATELDGLMGLSFIHIDLGTSDDPAEMATRLILTPEKIAKGSLKGFTVVDPTWCSPINYSTENALEPDFYKPQAWFVVGAHVHTTRLLPIISRPLPDILKPAYNFGGLALSQMLKPYVDNWLRTRQSVSDLINAFSIWVLETNMTAALGGEGGDDLDARLNLFTLLKNNRGAIAIDKEQEALSNVSAPLGTLDKLQAQSQEHMASVTRIPLVKQFGITPTGLNASSDGEIRTFYDSIHGRQERVYNDPLTICLKVIQLSEFGEIDEALTHEFVQLWELDEAGKAAVEKTKADTGAVLTAGGIITPDEERKRIASDPESDYNGLEGDAPEMPDPETEPNEEDDPTSKIDRGGAEGSLSEANSGV